VADRATREDGAQHRPARLRALPPATRHVLVTVFGTPPLCDRGGARLALATPSTPGGARPSNPGDSIISIH
jgi:hypothetical protein